MRKGQKQQLDFVKRTGKSLKEGRPFEKRAEATAGLCEKDREVFEKRPNLGQKDPCFERFQAMAKPVAEHAVVLKSAWGIDHGIDFLVLIMALFWMVFGIDFSSLFSI